MSDLRWSDLRPGDMFVPGEDYADRTPYVVLAVGITRDGPGYGYTGEVGIEVLSSRGERRQWWAPPGRRYFADDVIGRIGE